MPVKFGHEGLTESHDFVVALAFRVEFRAALAAAQRERGQGVLEHLFEGEKFQYAEIDGRVKPQTALVRTDRTVHLHPISSVHLHLAGIIYPRHPELNDSLCFQKAFHESLLTVFFAFLQEWPE